MIHPLKSYSPLSLVLVGGMLLYSIMQKALAQTNLAQEKWKHRVLIVLAPTDNHPELLKMRELALKFASDFKQRDLILWEEAGIVQKFHTQFQIPSDQFRLLLIGKDGGVKLKITQAVDSKKLFDLIDSMPMRQQEARAQHFFSRERVAH